MFFCIFFVPAIMIVLLVWLKSWERIKRYRLQADLYAKAIEKGESIPSLSNDFFAEPEKKSSGLKSGIICIAIGVGITLSLLLMAPLFGQIDDEKFVPVFQMLALIGIIPALIGVAFVIVHFIEKGGRQKA